MSAESQNGHHLSAYFSRGVHLPKYIHDMLEPYIPHRIELPKDEIVRKIAERVSKHQAAGETTTLRGGLVEYRTPQRPLVATLTDFQRDFRLYHFPPALEGKYPDNKVPLELGEGVIIVDGVLRMIIVPPSGGLPVIRNVPDGLIHSRDSMHMRVIGLGTLHDLGIR